MDNSNKIILDLCGGTGSWSEPYMASGYDVRLITFPNYDVTMFEPPKNVYGILAAPPCKEFSIAKGSKDRNITAALIVVNACFSVIQKCNYSCRLKFWALENPVGLLRQYIGIPKNQYFQWQFGELQYKHTDLWGYFNMPKPFINQIPNELEFFKGEHGVHWSKPVCPDKYLDMNLDRAAVRAITPFGFAKSFFCCNR